MTSSQGDSEIISAPYGKPCIACRKRKVKCDKIRPCSNCRRSKQLCTYEASHDSIGSGVDSQAGLHNEASILERLSRLEELMAKMMAGGDPASDRQRVVEHDITLSSEDSATLKAVSASQTSQFQPPESLSFPGTKSPVGLQIFREGYSGYFDSEFWPGMISEVCIAGELGMEDFCLTKICIGGRSSSLVQAFQTSNTGITDNVLQHIRR
jgi:hypothetical protein